LTPLPNTPTTTNAPWFANMAMGKNTLGTIVKNIAEISRIDCKKITNHGLRRTAISRVLAATGESRLGRKASGHSKNSNAIEQYDDVDVNIEQRLIQSAISGTSSTTTTVVKKRKIEIEKSTEEMETATSLETSIKQPTAILEKDGYKLSFFL